MTSNIHCKEPAVCMNAGKAEASNVSVRELIFGAPRLLEWIGLNIVKRDQLLGDSSCSQVEAKAVSCPLKMGSA